MDPRLRACTNLYKKAMSLYDEYVKYVIKSDQELDVFYLLLHNFPGENNEYVNGEFLVRLECIDRFPFTPPRYRFMTPQGLFEVESPTCISISEFHKENYNGALGISGFARELVNALIYWKDIDYGIGIINSTIEDKTALAANSRAYNAAHYPDIINLINNNYTEYSKTWKKL